jgi:hypothetical protein
MRYSVRGYRRGTWLLWVRRSTIARAAESASGVQLAQLERADGECAELALRAHQAFLPVRAPSCQRRLRVRPMLVGSVGTAPSARHVGGIERGRCGSRAVAVLSERTSGMRCDQELVLKGHPLLWGTVRWYRRRTSLLWVRRSTAERPSPLRARSYLNQNALNGCVPSSLSALTKLVQMCVTPSCHGVCTSAAEDGRDRSALLRARGMSGDACRGHRAGAVWQQGCCGTLRGDLGHAM